MNQEKINNDWKIEFERQLMSGQYPQWPNEVMVKILFGGANYLLKPVYPKSEWDVLEIGCLFGNNLLPFKKLGCKCIAVDIHPEIITIASKYNKNIEFQVGNNQNISVPDNSIDLLISVGTIHYEGTKENIIKAFKEFYRILKPGGKLYLSTTGPMHELFKSAEKIKDNEYIAKDFDFRDGERFFFFETEEFLKSMLDENFSHTETGRVTEKLIDFSFDSFFSLSTK